jgi:type III pantothenate kinase
MSEMKNSILLVDAGNTRLKWGLLGDRGIQNSQAITWQADRLSQQLQDHWQAMGQASLQRIVLSNVAGKQMMDAILAWAEEQAGHSGKPLKVEVVQAQASAYGVINGYTEPVRLGVDRWLGLVAARAQVAGASCIIDCGTALTVDVLSTEGRHLGGIIAPGIALMKHSLRHNTADLAAAGNAVTADGLGRDTPSAIQAGVMAAVSGAVLQVIHVAEAKLASSPTLVLSGGDAPLLLPVLRDALAPEYEIRHEADWVLQGLAIVAQGEV